VATDYRRDDERRRLTVVVRGPVTFEDVAEVIKRQAAEGTWSYTMIYDEREATSTLTHEEVQRLLALIGSFRAVHGRRGRVALIYNAEATHGTGRVDSAFGDIIGLDTAVFKDPSRAHAWLDGGR
jgi:hypothetical protein